MCWRFQATLWTTFPASALAGKVAAQLVLEHAGSMHQLRGDLPANADAGNVVHSVA